MENRDTMLIDSFDNSMGVYGSSEDGEMHQILEEGLQDKVEVRDVKVLIQEEVSTLMNMGAMLINPPRPKRKRARK